MVVEWHYPIPGFLSLKEWYPERRKYPNLIHNTLQEEYWVKRVRTQSHEDPYHRDYPVLEVTQCLPEEMTF